MFKNSCKNFGRVDQCQRAGKRVGPKGDKGPTGAVIYCYRCFGKGHYAYQCPKKVSNKLAAFFPRGVPEYLQQMIERGRLVTDGVKLLRNEDLPLEFWSFLEAWNEKHFFNSSVKKAIADIVDDYDRQFAEKLKITQPNDDFAKMESQAVKKMFVKVVEKALKIDLENTDVDVPSEITDENKQKLMDQAAKLNKLKSYLTVEKTSGKSSFKSEAQEAILEEANSQEQELLQNIKNATDKLERVSKDLEDYKKKYQDEINSSTNFKKYCKDQCGYPPMDAYRFYVEETYHENMKPYSSMYAKVVYKKKIRELDQWLAFWKEQNAKYNKLFAKIDEQLDSLNDKYIFAKSDVTCYNQEYSRMKTITSTMSEPHEAENPKKSLIDSMMGKNLSNSHLSDSSIE
jgi:hypothetical protein